MYIVNNATNIAKILRKYKFLKKKKSFFLVINNIDLYICSVKKIICRQYYRTDLTVQREAMPEAIRRLIQTELK